MASGQRAHTSRTAFSLGGTKHKAVGRSVWVGQNTGSGALRLGGTKHKAVGRSDWVGQNTGSGGAGRTVYNNVYSQTHTHIQPIPYD